MGHSGGCQNANANLLFCFTPQRNANTAALPPTPAATAALKIPTVLRPQLALSRPK